MNRADRVKQLALAVTAAFFLVCALRFWLLYGDGAPWRVECTRDETAAAAQAESDWPVSLLPGERIDVNAAPAVELTRLPGIGAARAQAIADWRAEHGPFQSPEQLMEVPGIGPGILAQISEYITVSNTD